VMPSRVHVLLRRPSWIAPRPVPRAGDFPRARRAQIDSLPFVCLQKGEGLHRAERGWVRNVPHRGATLHSYAGATNGDAGVEDGPHAGRRGHLSARATWHPDVRTATIHAKVRTLMLLVTRERVHSSQRVAIIQRELPGMAEKNRPDILSICLCNRLCNNCNRLPPQNQWPAAALP